MVSLVNIWDQVRPAELFGTFRPVLRNVPTMEACVKMNADGSAPGVFRFCVNFKRFIAVELELKDYIEDESVAPWAVELSFVPNDIVFPENGVVAKWFDLKTEIEKDTVMVKKRDQENFDNDVLRPIISRILADLNKKGIGLALRFELDLNSDQELSLHLRCLPVPADRLVGHTFFGQQNVGSREVDVFDVKFTNFNVASGSNLFIPFVFGDNIECSSERLWESTVLIADRIKERIPCHGFVNDISSYVKKPDGVSPNTFEWGKATAPAPKRRKTTDTDHTYADQGIANLKTKANKFGPNFDLGQYQVSILPVHLKNIVNYSLTTASWDHYKSAWNAFSEFQLVSGTKFEFPLSSSIIVEFIMFLFYKRELKLSTIYSYLSAIKFLHKLKNLKPIYSLDDPLISLTLNGIKNHQKVHTMGNSLRRRVITFPVLKLLGHEIFMSDLSKHDKLLVWSVSTLAFFTCCRLGELIFQQTDTFDKTSNFLWKNVRIISEDHFVIYSPCPKVSRDPKGYVMDVMSFNDIVYARLRISKSSLSIFKLLNQIIYMLICLYLE